MPQVSHRFAVRFYNFSSVLCVKEKNRILEVSNFGAICNVLKLPFVLLFTFFIYATFSEGTKMENFENFRKFSTFSTITLFVVAVSLNLVTFLSAVFQVTRRHAVKDFVNFWMSKSLDQEYLQQYKKTCFKHHVLGLVVMSTFIFPQYLAAMNTSLMVALVSSFVFMYPYYLLFGMMSFVLSFQNFVFESLKEFRRDLKKFSRQDSKGHEVSVQRYLRVSRKYQEIYDLVEQFKSCFGFQLTFLTCYLTLILVCTVSIGIER